MKTIYIHLISASEGMQYENVINTYVKEDMFCVLFHKNNVKRVHKYPLMNIFRVEHLY